MSAEAPRLLVVAHGTRSAEGRAVIGELVEGLRRRFSGEGSGGDRSAPEIALAWVDVLSPTPADVLADGRNTVVVPCFLAAGYHVRVDVPEAAEAAPGDTVVTPHLGAAAEIVDVLADRLAEAGAAGRGPDAVVLGAAGSRDPGAVAEVEATARLLADRLWVPVTCGYASAASPTVAEAVDKARKDGARRVAVATHLLAPGFFADRLSAAGADLVSAPLGAHSAVIDLVERRYRESVAGAGITH